MKVLTWNLYVGADLTRTIEADTDEEVLAANAEIFRVLHHTNFPERARPIAARIVEADAAVVALQEAAAWFTGPLGDPVPAATVEYDFVNILLDELTNRGVPYTAVHIQNNSDSQASAGPPYSHDLRLLDRDAILVRTDLVADVSSVRAAHFAAQLSISTGTGRMVEALRGWISFTLTVEGRPIAFVNCHLEAFNPRIRRAQAEELVSPSGPLAPVRSSVSTNAADLASSPAPTSLTGSASPTPSSYPAPGFSDDVVLLGDLNTGPDLPIPENREAFFVLTEAGLVDSWAALHPGDPGYTAGFGELLDDPSPATLQHRVDHVMTRGAIAATASRIVGLSAADHTSSGLWPSDHAGLVATLTV